MSFVNSLLILDLPPSPSHGCKDMFQREKYLWKGKTFVVTIGRPQPSM
jgi:hypothetical protein